MGLDQLIILSLVQGITEFLPISSSAHLILAHEVVPHWEDQGLAFDVAAHVGSLIAVIIYFRKEIAKMWFAFGKSLTGQHSPDSKLAWAVLLGTIPVGLAGLLFKDFIEIELRSPLVIAAATIFFGLILVLAEFLSRKQRNEYSLRIIDIVFIGVAQALALIPGTSRSGITISAGLFLGLTPEAAARFSFLLSIPVIVLAGGLEIRDLIIEPERVDWIVLIIGTLLSGLSAFLCIHYFLKFIQRIGMIPFMVYRVILGIILFIIFLPKA